MTYLWRDTTVKGMARYHGYDQPLNDREMQITLEVIDRVTKENAHTCEVFTLVGSKDNEFVQARWEFFWGQTTAYWDFTGGGYCDDFNEVNHQERLLMLATFLELRGVIP